ncbi:MAG: hypothetical protein R3350_01600, partial [Saprospiraceae bacterium]|nr:hypothetical protein [Saprospiraceae bacterium]
GDQSKELSPGAETVSTEHPIKISVRNFTCFSGSYRNHKATFFVLCLFFDAKKGTFVPALKSRF